MNVNVWYQSHKRAIISRPFHRLTIRPHMHKGVELIYLTGGSCIAIADQKRYSLTPGDLFVAFPNQLHYYLTSEPVLGHLVVFDPILISSLKHEFSQFIPENNVIHIREDNLAYAALTDLAATSSHTSLTIQSGFLHLIMGDTLSLMKLTPHKQTNLVNLQNILDYCETHFCEKLTLDIIADALHISKSHISRLFNKHMQIGFSDYISMIRVNNACSIIESSPTHSFARISEDVGFGSIRSFNRAFQNIMGMPPTAYRQLASTNTLTDQPLTAPTKAPFAKYF